MFYNSLWKNKEKLKVGHSLQFCVRLWLQDSTYDNENKKVFKMSFFTFFILHIQRYPQSLRNSWQKLLEAVVFLFLVGNIEAFKSCHRTSLVFAVLLYVRHHIMLCEWRQQDVVKDEIDHGDCNRISPLQWQWEDDETVCPLETCLPWEIDNIRILAFCVIWFCFVF